jgi:hypothetical protein
MLETPCLAVIFKTQKKRGGRGLLSGVEVSELRLRWTADPPRPSQLRPVPQISAPGLRSRVFYPRLIYRRLSACRLRLLSRASPVASGVCAPSAFFRPSGSRLPIPDLPQPKSLLAPPFRGLNRFRSLDSRQLYCLQSFSSLRLSPPGVYLKGSRFPLESPHLVRPASCRARSGRHAQYHVSIQSVVRYPPLCLLAGRPSGRRVSSNGELKLLLVLELVNGTKA